uniref:Secreted protein n=1 Tax=Acrobeloides nanus TaxID=290746 RepID=A0A914CE38_9BILA
MNRLEVLLFGVLLTCCQRWFWCYGIHPSRWLSPLDNSSRLRSVCTENNHLIVVHGSDSHQLRYLANHSIMCDANFEFKLQTRRFVGLIWFMRTLGFCEFKRSLQTISGTRLQYDFPLDFLQAAYSIVCLSDK